MPIVGLRIIDPPIPPPQKALAKAFEGIFMPTFFHRSTSLTTYGVTAAHATLMPCFFFVIVGHRAAPAVIWGAIVHRAASKWIYLWYTYTGYIFLVVAMATVP